MSRTKMRCLFHQGPGVVQHKKTTSTMRSLIHGHLWSSLVSGIVLGMIINHPLINGFLIQRNTMCTYVHSRNHPLQSQPLKASWRSLSVIASILIIDRISPALLLTSHDQDLHIYIYIYIDPMEESSACFYHLLHPSFVRTFLAVTDSPLLGR